MGFKDFIKEEEEKQVADDKMGAIFDFFANNPDPKDEVIHKLGEDLGIKPDEFETMIYSILSSILAHGKYKENPVDADPEQIKMGTEVEKEHTNMPAIAKRIALDHLAEIPDYYTRLKKMEDETKTSKDKE
jgi:hypothetical protein